MWNLLALKTVLSSVEIELVEGGAKIRVKTLG